MLTVPNSIAPFISEQLPAFYQNEGPLFIAFMEAYYEWLSQSVDRQVLANRDIDLAAEEFLENFKATYLPDIPFSSVTNKRLLVKNAMDLYRSKGTSRGIDLFMKLVYGVGAQVKFPGDNVLRPSDSKWTLPRFIEVSKSPHTITMGHKTVTGGLSKATAFVEGVQEQRATGDRVDVIHISDIRGTFIKGEPITVDSIYDDSPTIVGSPIYGTIVDGGANFEKYQDLRFVGARGEHGIARVLGVSDAGAITLVKIIESGIGFSDGETAYIQFEPGYTGASMTVETGAVGHLQGYKEGPGLSDSHIHDSDYWQEFSYDVMTALPLEKYVGALKTVLHVAGHKMFGSLVINSIASAMTSDTYSAIS